MRVVPIMKKLKILESGKNLLHLLVMWCRCKIGFHNFDNKWITINRYIYKICLRCDHTITSNGIYYEEWGKRFWFDCVGSVTEYKEGHMARIVTAKELRSRIYSGTKDLPKD